MRTITVADGIEYGLLEEADAGDMARLLAEAFSRFEPMGAAARIPHDQIERLVEAFVPKALSEKLTIVARDDSEGQLVGALLADDFGTAPPPGLEEVAPGFAPVASLLDALDDQYRAETPVTPGTHAHLFMLGVAENAGSRGIAGKLTETCIANAARMGYRTAIAEATGSASQHVLRKRGFTERFVASYKEFTFNGRRVFSSIEGVEGTILMTRELGELSRNHVAAQRGSRPQEVHMPVPASVQEFWDEFRAAVEGVDESRFYEAAAFGDSEELANRLAELVLSGRKRATAGSIWSYEAEGQPLPSVGDLSILTNWAGDPVCVIEITAVEIVPFRRVSAEFAAAEGEGDGTLESWRVGHRAFFTRECRRIGRSFDEEMPVCCERFEVVYRRGRRSGT